MGTEKEELIASTQKARADILDAQIGLQKAWIDADELNKQLVEAGIPDQVIVCW